MRIGSVESMSDVISEVLYLSKIGLDDCNFYDAIHHWWRVDGETCGPRRETAGERLTWNQYADKWTCSRPTVTDMFHLLGSNGSNLSSSLFPISQPIASNNRSSKSQTHTFRQWQFESERDAAPNLFLSLVPSPSEWPATRYRVRSLSLSFSLPLLMFSWSITSLTALP